MKINLSAKTYTSTTTAMPYPNTLNWSKKFDNTYVSSTSITDSTEVIYSTNINSTGTGLKITSGGSGTIDTLGTDELIAYNESAIYKMDGTYVTLPDLTTTSTYAYIKVSS